MLNNTNPVEIRESARSRKQQILKLVSTHCGHCVELPEEENEGRHAYRVKFGRRRWPLPPRHVLTIMSRDHTDLFFGGRAVDLDIHVFDPKLITPAVALAAEYNQLTGKKADVVKEF
jgi:hypothetical protein